jgi:hypothetical protein
MNVLRDACVPRPLRRFLPGHTVRVAQEMGWGQLKNGALLKEPELGFDAFITSDQDLKCQQKVVGRKLAILVLPTKDWAAIWLKAGEIAAQVAELKPGDFVELNWI